MKLLYELAVEKLPQSRFPIGLLKQAAVVRGDAVAEYIHEFKDGFIGIDDIPNAAPPFENFWIEETGDFPEQPSSIPGVTLFRQREPATTAQWFVASPTAEHGAKWEMICLVFQKRQSAELEYGGGFKFWVNADGSPNRDNKGAVLIYTPPVDVPNAHTLAQTMAGQVWAGLLVVSFMHCKNVEMVEHGPHLRAAGTRNRRGPKVKYYTLEIEPMKKVLRTEGQSEAVGLKKALHICRGHFAHYTDDKKLFGKYTGTFWRPMHTRGSIEQGEVIKDYKIGKPPEPPQ